MTGNTSNCMWYIPGHGHKYNTYQLLASSVLISPQHRAAEELANWLTWLWVRPMSLERSEQIWSLLLFISESHKNKRPMQEKQHPSPNKQASPHSVHSNSWHKGVTSHQFQASPNFVSHGTGQQKWELTNWTKPGGRQCQGEKGATRPSTVDIKSKSLLGPLTCHLHPLGWLHSLAINRSKNLPWLGC